MNSKQRVFALYISHRIEEIFKICDRITVLKDGKKVNTVNVSDVNEEQLVRMMIGHDMKDFFRRGKLILEK